MGMLGDFVQGAARAGEQVADASIKNRMTIDLEKELSEIRNNREMALKRMTAEFGDERRATEGTAENMDMKRVQQGLDKGDAEAREIARREGLINLRKDGNVKREDGGWDVLGTDGSKQVVSKLNEKGELVGRSDAMDYEGVSEKDKADIDLKKAHANAYNSLAKQRTAGGSGKAKTEEDASIEMIEDEIKGLRKQMIGGKDILGSSNPDAEGFANKTNSGLTKRIALLEQKRMYKLGKLDVESLARRISFESEDDAELKASIEQAKMIDTDLAEELKRYLDTSDARPKPKPSTTFDPKLAKGVIRKRLDTSKIGRPQ
jgi:hypothetical protein